MAVAETLGGAMHIGELAERTGLSLRTIRHYDEIGNPKASGRTEGGFRVYTTAEMSRLLLIRRMKPLGFSFDEMTELLATIDLLAGGTPGFDTSDTRATLEKFIADVEGRRARLKEPLAMADEFLQMLKAQ